MSSQTNAKCTRSILLKSTQSVTDNELGTSHAEMVFDYTDASRDIY